MISDLSLTKIKKLHEKIFSWWEENKREFPWRETEDPYEVMVAEVMLQQTQASSVVSKFTEFLEKFPDNESLSKASKQELLSTWSGLGYNRRALWLQEAAQQLLDLDEFPTIPEELQKLKGIGKYSANSILIFAFNFDLATVDTNIRRILIAEGFAEEDTSEKSLFQIAEQLLPKGKSRDWHNALMDYGALHLTASSTGIKPTTKQPKFKGSDREKRGKILKYLINGRKASIEELISITEGTMEPIERILDKMEKDGLLTKKEGFYQIE